tara:strand:- start:7540 stop:9186 length:1647 start_codon:yes stop_codon:yes gene_type:complete
MEPVFYRKNKNVAFTYLEKELYLNDIQNYTPIYDVFFTLNDSNRNNINLNNKWEIVSITKKVTDKVYECFVEDIKGNKKKVNIFFKFAPLLDPLKYLIGKYENIDITSLPNNNKECNKKMLDVNNSAYVDNFFSYLTSRLLHEYGFIHGLDYHGGFLAIKNNYIFNCEDDIDYMVNSSFFNKNKDYLFTLTDQLKELINNDSIKKKIKIDIKDEENLNLSSLMNICGLEDNPDIVNSTTTTDISLVEVNKNSKGSQSKSTQSSCSSRSSITDNEDEDEDDDNDEDDDEDDEDDDEDDEYYNVNINEFPVNVIALEACKTTLDELIEEDISYAEIISAFMQIIMTLVTYQKVFNFTHNDLHTNNIMFIDTDKQHIYYHYQGIYYKVPTFGKIFKIIDFGRAIYKYNGKLHCSDSFSQNGDAATQYNFEPYFNDKKPRLEPNYSFDLCRLACSLYDNLLDDEQDDEIYNPVKIIIEKWCKDDKNRNILYKNNGEERYPEFKLYKMIARSVHNLTPKSQLEDDIFKKYVVSKKSIKNKTKIVDIDAIPCMI